VLLFLGGWGGPLLPDLVWLFAKTYAMVFMIIWVRATLPRVRIDQLMAVGWKLLLPAALINVLITAVGIVTSPVVLVVLEFAAAAAFVVLVSWLGEHAGDRLRAQAAARLGACRPADLAPAAPVEASTNEGVGA
jgi:NADH-quinone oxidoreductase subunit H